MSKDIVVFIPSRSSPEKLNKTIEEALREQNEV